MKKLYILYFFIFLCPSFALVKQHYNVAVLNEWKPYYFINSEGKADGYAIELFEKLAKSRDIEYKYIIYKNFKGVFEGLEKGEVDIIPNIGITQRRENLLLFTQSTDTFFINLYKRAQSKEIETLDDLKNKTIGVVSLNVCNKLITQSQTTKKRVYENFFELISALKSQEIDAFCYPQPLVKTHIDDVDIVPLKMAIKEIQRGIGVSKNQFHLLPLLNDAITELKLSGEYKKIHDKWFGEHNYLELSKQEIVFTIVTLMGAFFTFVIVVLYFLSKKKWVLTKGMLEDEIIKKTRILTIQNRRLKLIHKRLKEQTYKDVMTKIYNRKFYNEKIEELISLFRRYEYTFTFLIFDIDDFKNVNDTYGHDVGDKVLIALANLVGENVRVNDYFFRVGGEEFVLLLSETHLNEAKEVAIKIKDKIEKKLNVISNYKITISGGLTEINKSDDSESIYKRADTLLYKAKNSGKNRIVWE